MRRGSLGSRGPCEQESAGRRCVVDGSAHQVPRGRVALPLVYQHRRFASGELLRVGQHQGQRGRVVQVIDGARPPAGGPRLADCARPLDADRGQLRQQAVELRIGRSSAGSRPGPALRPGLVELPTSLCPFSGCPPAPAGCPTSRSPVPHFRHTLRIHTFLHYFFSYPYRAFPHPRRLQMHTTRSRVGTATLTAAGTAPRLQPPASPHGSPAAVRGDQALRRWVRSWVTALPSAWPRVAFMTAPTKTPATLDSPSQNFCHASGLSAMA